MRYENMITLRVIASINCSSKFKVWVTSPIKSGFHAQGKAFVSRKMAISSATKKYPKARIIDNGGIK